MVEKAPVILPLMNQRRWVSDQKDGASTIQTSGTENALDAKRKKKKTERLSGGAVREWPGTGARGVQELSYL